MDLRRAIFLILALYVAPVRGADPDPEVVFAEQTLKGGAVPTDGPALLRFFRERTLTPAERSRLTDAVRRLGDDEFVDTSSLPGSTRAGP